MFINYIFIANKKRGAKITPLICVFYCCYGTSFTISAAVMLFMIKIQLLAVPLSCKNGYVSPSPILHQCIGLVLKLDKSKGTPLL